MSVIAACVSPTSLQVWFHACILAKQVLLLLQRQLLVMTT
jgi:hypothetical protein